jgi:hypothetical protein
LSISAEKQAPSKSSPANGAGIVVSQVAYHGWKDCYRLASAALEVMVVPAIGRIMQIRRTGDTAGVLWENRVLDGQLAQPHSGTWANFGGDKCWPSPQSDWPRVMGHDWPPPAAFDASPLEASVTDSGVMLKGPVDAAWGVRAVRYVELDSSQPVMRVRTEFRKVQGKAIRVGVWTIAQFNDPACVAIELPTESRFAGGYTHLSKPDPEGLAVNGRVLTFVRHARKFVKIGSDAAEVVWVGPSSVVRMESGFIAGEYPDGGCRVEVYTNPGEQKYVELETLGPLVNLEAGQMIEHTTTYTVTARTVADARDEAGKAV